MEDSAEAHFFSGEAFVVLVEGGLNSVMIGMVGLNNDAAGAVSSSCSAGELGEEIVGSLDGSEIRESEIGVGGEDGGERNSWEVVAFGDHLGSDEDSNISAAEAF
jgi:hypothetical protein